MDIIKYLGIPAVAFLGFIVFCFAKGGNNKNNDGGNNKNTTTSAPTSTPTGGSDESKG